MALSAEDIMNALRELSEEMKADQRHAEIIVVGGAALVLLFEARETTKDVDAFFVQPAASEIRAAAERVAGRLGLPADWLNDDAKGFLVGITTGSILYEAPSLLVRAASIEQLLAMKLGAWRDAIDREDARLLLSKITGSAEDVWARVEPLVTPPQVDKAWYAFQDLWEATHGTE